MPTDLILSSDVQDVLQRCAITEERVYLPQEQLPRPLYVAVDKALRAAGGKWNKHLQCHVFTRDPRVTLLPGIGTGSVPKVQQQLQSFYTPPALAAKVVALAELEPGMCILEPSAGMGALALEAAKTVPTTQIWCVDSDPLACTVLRDHGFAYVVEQDFLSCIPVCKPIIDDSSIQKGEEIWKPVKGFEEHYSVSTWGRLKRLKTIKRYKAGDIVNGGVRVDGYINVTLCKNGEKISRLLHQIVAETFLGQCPQGMQVNHKHSDGDKSRNWLSNLEYLSSKENNADQRVKRPATYAAKISQIDADTIRKRVLNGESKRILSVEYGISLGNINYILLGKTWQKELPFFDRVILNPPFVKGADMTHIQHAHQFLLPGGRLVAIVPAMTGKKTRKNTEKAFLQFLDQYQSYRIEVPAGTFAASGTQVATSLLVLHT